MDRRDFIAKSSILGFTYPISQLPLRAPKESSLAVVKHNGRLEDLYTDENYWKQVRQLYQRPKGFINLENGYFTPQASPVLNAEIQNARMVNEQSSFYMRNHQADDYAETKNAVANFIGCSEDELAICRNTTEALDTVIHGIDWKRGDEVINTHQDYGSMLAAFDQEEKRHGIVQKRISLPLNPKDDDEVVDAFSNAITSKTRLILVTHLINLSGQILPAKKIVEMARKRNVKVMLDSAHALAHIKFNLKEIDPDFMGTSLHKWLGCPLGLGVLYVKKEQIPNIWPLFGDNEYAQNDIRKLQHYGTRPVHSFLSIKKAIELHHAIGSDLKQKRLQYLKQYWISRVKDIEKVHINTPEEATRSCAIGNFSIEGISPNDLAQKLFEEHKIFTVAINSKEINGVRVTPHLYNSLDELDALVKAIKNIAKE